MNYPNYYQPEATLDQGQLVVNVVNAISPRVDITPDFLNALKGSRSV